MILRRPFAAGWIAGAVVVAVASAGALPGCRSDRVEVADPVVMLDENDPELVAARMEARETIDQCIQAVTKPRPEQEYVSVKARFADGGRVEFLWLVDLEFDNGTFTGMIDTEPRIVEHVQAGQVSSVHQNDIEDWMIIEGGQLRGGYTIKVLARRGAQ